MLPPTYHMNVYLMRLVEPLQDLLDESLWDESLWRDDEQRPLTQDVRVGGIDGLLATAAPRQDALPWTPVLTSLTGVARQLHSVEPGAVLLLPVDGRVFALTFGRGWRWLSDRHLEHGFGFRVAVRVLDPSELRRVTRYALYTHGRVDSTSVPGGLAVRAFGIEEYAEIVRKVSGRTRRLELTHLHNVRPFVSLEGSDSLKVSLATTESELINDLRAITDTLHRQSPDPELERLDRIRRVPAGSPVIADLDARLAELLGTASSGEPAELDGARLGVAYPWSADIDDGDVHRYRIRLTKETNDYDWENDGQPDISQIVSKVAHLPKAERLPAVDEGWIIGYSRADDSDIIPRTRLRRLLAAEIPREDRRYVLLHGMWYDLGDAYAKTVASRVREVLQSRPRWEPQLPAWTSGDENSYNNKVAKAPG